MKNKDTWSRSIVWGDDYTEQEPGMVEEQSVRLALPRMTPSLPGSVLDARTGAEDKGQR